MISGKYISSIGGMIISIIMLPALEDVLKIVLIVFVILISVATNLVFFWGALKTKFLHDLYPDMLSILYKNDDFVQFLIERQKKKVRK